MSPVPPRDYNARTHAHTHNHSYYYICVYVIIYRVCVLFFMRVRIICVCVCVQMKTGIGFRPSVPENLSHNSPAPDSVAAVYLRFFVVVLLRFDSSGSG